MSKRKVELIKSLRGSLCSWMGPAGGVRVMDRGLGSVSSLSASTIACHARRHRSITAPLLHPPPSVRAVSRHLFTRGASRYCSLCITGNSSSEFIHSFSTRTLQWIRVFKKPFRCVEILCWWAASTTPVAPLMQRAQFAVILVTKPCTLAVSLQTQHFSPCLVEVACVVTTWQRTSSSPSLLRTQLSTNRPQFLFRELLLFRINLSIFHFMKQNNRTKSFDRKVTR